VVSGSDTIIIGKDFSAYGENMKCSVVVRSYNEEEHIGRLLVGIKEQNLQPHEIIVVDSGSTDRTVEIAQNFGAKIICIKKREFSFGRALNIGCHAATGDILVFASAHVYPVHKTWLEKLIEPFGDERVVLCYGKQRGNHLNKFSEHQVFKKWFPSTSVCPQNSYFCNNANCAIRRSDWEKYPYDETLSGLEDMDWAKGAQARGGWIAYAAGAQIIHVHDETWEYVRNRYRREAMAMKKINGQVGFNLLDLAGLLPANIISDYRAARNSRKLWQELISIPLFRFNQLWGTYQGRNGPCEVTADLKNRFYFPASHKIEDPEPVELTIHRINYDLLSSNTDNRNSSAFSPQANFKNKIS